MKTPKFWMIILPLVLVFGLVLGGCASDGSDGLSAYEIAVDNGFVGTEAEWLDTLSGSNAPGDGSWFGEYCTSCHADDGTMHQASYDQFYQDGVIVVSNLAYAYSATSDVVTFEMTKNGNDFNCEDVENMSIYYTPYDSGTSSFALSTGRLSVEGTVAYNDTTNVCTSTKAASALGDLDDAMDGLIVVYGRDETISSIPGTRVAQAKYPYAAVLKLGTVAYTSAANNAGCEKCHTVPFLKHGYIYGETGAGTDFYVCKACHLDDGDGGHFMWQLLVDDPYLIIELEEDLGEDWEDFGTDPRLLPYAYKTSLMNDVHMSHAQEFPYPQSMSNCATCHSGKLGVTLTQANFTLETCKSCHPVTDADGESIMDAPALFDVMPTSGPDHSTYIDATYADASSGCSGCHGGAPGPAFDEIHTGYDPMIYSDAGNKFSDSILVTIVGAAFNDTTSVLTVTVTATGSANAGSIDSADIAMRVGVGMYGMYTKDFLATDTNFGTMDTSTSGTWVASEDLSEYAYMIGELGVDAGAKIQRAEIMAMPDLNVAIDAVTRTFDLDANAFDDGYYDDIVRVDTGCNNCHDELNTTFHLSGDAPRGRGGSIEVCRLCHVTTRGGSHLEMQSRSIDSYVHAIHSFQPFDFDEIDFDDAVEELHYEHHIGFVYPTLGFDCESCHISGTYDVPSQLTSMPGLLSDSETNATIDRDIVDIPEYVTGPAGRACGSCHRVPLINHDDASGLAELNQHIEDYGYLWENDSDDVILGYIVDVVFSVYP